MGMGIGEAAGPGAGRDPVPDGGPRAPEIETSGL